MAEDLPPPTPAQVRAFLRDLMSRMSDEDLLALWRLIYSWVLEDQHKD